MNPFPQETPSSTLMVEIKKDLFRNAMQGNWEEVISIYRNHSQAHTAKITRSGDTAIHVAISDGQARVVRELVSVTRNSSEALGIGNELGNTPLHLAASLGNVAMCACIAGADSGLIGKHNSDGDTPFFLSVAHGRKHAFLCLHSFCGDGEGYNYCRRKSDGETILHSAISGEYFDLAFQIMCLYERLVNSVNVYGVSPLHVLATKPSAFSSGTQIRGFMKLIYHCIIVDELKLESHHHALSEDFQYNQAEANYPENCQTCVGFAIFVRNLARAVLGYANHDRTEKPDAENPKEQKFQELQLFPPNYRTWFLGLKLISKSMLVILGLGSRGLVKLRDRKEKNTWSIQIMRELLDKASAYEYENNGINPHHLASNKDRPETAPYFIDDASIVKFKHDNFFTVPPLGLCHDHGHSSSAARPNNSEKSAGEEMGRGETPILIAARNGVVEMVERILELFPMAIHDMNTENKNVVLLAVENRHPHVYKFLHGLKIMKDTIFRVVDKDGNSALHHAAKLGHHRPWLIPGAALQMQWEIKWYEFVKDSMPQHFFVRYNKQNQTPRELFTQSHDKLVKEGGQWLTSTSESCSVVAALIATVSFATSATVPGGVRADVGTPTLENESAFSIFAISSLVALCFSVTAVVMFLAILTSRYEGKDFGKDLPRKLLLGLTSLFVSIASVLVSFCAGHFFMLRDKLKYAALPVYAVTCLPVTFFGIAQFPLYFDLVKAAWRKMPQKSHK